MQNTISTLDELNAKLSELETGDYINEYDIYDKIISLCNPAIEEVQEYLWECYAFAFDDNGVKQNPDRKCVFGPLINRNGEEYPSIKLLNNDVVAYWGKRANSATNPVFKARYSELAWVFSKIICGKSDITYIPYFVDAVVEMTVDKRYSQNDDLYLFDKLERALKYSASIKNDVSIQKIKKAIFDHEKSAEDHVLGMWGHCFDFFIAKNTIPLTPEEEKEIIDDLRQRFDRAKNSATRMRIRICENAGLRIAQYHRKKGDLNEARNIVASFCKLLDENAGNCSLAAESLFLYQKAADLCDDFGMRGENEQYIKLVDRTTPKILAEMHAITGKIDVSKDELDNFAKTFITGNLHQALREVAWYFMRPQKFYQEHTKQIQSISVLQSIFSKAIIDGNGRFIAEIAPDDDDGNLVFHTAQFLYLNAPFLHYVFNYVFKRYSAQSSEIVEYLATCPLFSEVVDRDILSIGIKHHMNADYCSAIHVLIPQIERAVRVILRDMDATTLKARRGGGYHQKTLDEMLRAPKFVEFWGSDDIPYYLRVILSDQRGWNLRNNVCHGLYSNSYFIEPRAEIILLILLLLASTVIMTEKTDSSPDIQLQKQ